ncbi:MAG: cytochrome d ubiquinol oxidase subunit II [Acidiferrobacterales bacterium]|nr:cytochrome d ubiquinol oxidase subunit II [Acidiferrobacterales bacterium]
MHEDQWLPMVFIGLMGLSMMIYAILDGYDLGVGILLKTAPAEHRDRMIASIGPFWDANETWLVLGVGLLLVAFPKAHGIILTTLYFPVAVMLLGLILRGVSFDFRAKARTGYKALWDNLFWIGSLMASSAQGFMLGRYILGFEQTTSALLFALLSAICVTAGYALVGACWLIMKTEKDLQLRSIKWAKATLIFTATGILCVSIVNPFVSERIFERWFAYPDVLLVAPIPVIAIGLLIGSHIVLKSLPRSNDEWCWVPFVCVAMVFMTSFIGLAYSFYPYVIPDQMTIWEAASASASLRVILYGAAVVLPMILLYTIFSYRVFWGKATSLRYE